MLFNKSTLVAGGGIVEKGVVIVRRVVNQITKLIGHNNLMGNFTHKFV